MQNFPQCFGELGVGHGVGRDGVHRAGQAIAIQRVQNRTDDVGKLVDPFKPTLPDDEVTALVKRCTLGGHDDEGKPIRLPRHVVQHVERRQRGYIIVTTMGRTLGVMTKHKGQRGS